MLAGRISEVQVVSRAEPEGMALEITAMLLDPFRKIRRVSVCCVPRDVKTPTPVPQMPLENSEKIDLVVEQGKAVGTWRISGTAGKPDVVSVQPMCVDADGKTVYEAATQHRLSSPGTPPVKPLLPAPRPVVRETRKVHRGASSQLGDNLLVGGVLVLGDRTPALGLGVVQTGEATMNVTYFAIVRLPAGTVSRTSFLTRSKTVGEQTRADYGAFLDDTSLTIEHAYAADKTTLEQEELTILDQKFNPANGRLFFVDLSAATPRVAQKKIELPAALTLVPIDDEHLIDLADKTLEDLSKANDEVRAFASGGKKKSVSPSPK
jgi:hypothetical protein